MEKFLLISDAARAVQVESHVLRYWEEELHLPIRRNELGHRYYTQDDIDRFKNIKSMKERGLQLKAIKMILKNGKLDVLTQDREEGQGEECRGGEPQREEHRNEEHQGEWLQVSEPREREHPATEQQIAGQQPEEKTWLETADAKSSEVAAGESVGSPESREEKAQRLQWIMQQLIRQAVQENNEEMVRQIKESVLKELDYQFRMQEERLEERAKQTEERTENYYRKMDELLRKKSGRNLKEILGKKSEKKKKHFAV